MATLDPTKDEHEFIAKAEFDPDVTSVELGTPDDVGTYFEGNVYIRYAPLQTAGSDPPPTFKVQAQGDDVIDDAWSDTGLDVATDTSAPVQQTLDGAANSAQRVIPLGATANLTVGDQCYIRNTDAQTGEWIEIAEIADGVSITTVDNLAASYSADATADTVTNGAIRRNFTINLRGIRNIRVLLTMYDAAGDTFVAEVKATWMQDISDA